MYVRMSYLVNGAEEKGKLSVDVYGFYSSKALVNTHMEHFRPAHIMPE